MRMAVRKLRVEGVEQLQALVVEHFDAIEPGLTVLDARLLLGHATIDVIAVDAVGTLVLGAVGFNANEEMLLKAVEAYSWCLEYPEALVRHYPSCQVSEERPPRLLFVVDRMPDAFHRKIKQLGFPEVDCVEFRHLEVDGVPTVYFESLLRLRRGTPARQSDDATPAIAPRQTENVITVNAAAAPTTGAKLPKSGAEPGASSPRAADRPAPSREPATVVSMVSRQTTVAVPRLDRPQSVPMAPHEPEPLVTRAMAGVPDLEVTDEPAPSLAPTEDRQVPRLSVRPATADAVPSMATDHAPTMGQSPERVSFKQLADSLLGAMTATQEALAPAAAARVKPVTVDPLALESAIQEALAAPLPPETKKVAEPRPAMTPEPPVVPTAVRPVTKPASIASAAKAPAAADRPAAETAKPTSPALPQGFEGLTFPNDGVLTRQWMEFLNQMSTTK